ncbi:Uncharacterized protein PECH_005055 [Penicillium ucsense]|uniref:Elongation of fatty acids protein n=1 Tax=Penicillium ucsense TaxID=2839758 RepID=A0A8J8W5P2_9EURO|nr:Uncharacterized protein PECM_005855 [Penicillium ucsense]KAF7736691.1 Uncharacterized protein PECH_005055 [Penicillium ucsense]
MAIPHGESLIVFRFPPSALFTLPPSQSLKPATRLPPLPPSNVLGASFIQSIRIDPLLFRLSLDLRFVLTFTALYVSTVLYLNRVNAYRQFRPWKFSRTPWFKHVVVAHNSLLAIFSGWTFVSLFHIFLPLLRRARAEAGPHYASHLAELLCETDSGAYRVLSFGNSLWEAGGSYVGWWFYMSKFYEIVDTLIILARGKKSSTLQTYHHAGVIICGWATIIYESPLGAIGVFLNSAIHTLMYMYFTIQTLGIPIPVSFKRNLTKLQLAQFFVGWIWGYTYLFMSYRIPSRPNAGKTERDFVHSDNLTRVLRRDSPASLQKADVLHESVDAVSCLSDSGEAFTIVVTSVYIIPLIYLFIKFYLQSYRGNGKGIRSGSQVVKEPNGLIH